MLVLSGAPLFAPPPVQVARAGVWLFLISLLTCPWSPRSLSVSKPLDGRLVIPLYLLYGDLVKASASFV